jgi:hypothetical protein
VQRGYYFKQGSELQEGAREFPVEAALPFAGQVSNLTDVPAGQVGNLTCKGKDTAAPFEPNCKGSPVEVAKPAPSAGLLAWNGQAQTAFRTVSYART